MVDRANPVQVREWPPLAVRDGDKRSIFETADRGAEIGQIEPTVKGREEGHVEPAQDW